MLKGYAGCHVTRLHIMTLGPLSRVMMGKPPFHAQNVENSCFLCAKFSPGQLGQQLHCPGRHSNPVYPPVDWASPPCPEVCNRHGDFSLAAVSGWVSPTGRCSLDQSGKTLKLKKLKIIPSRIDLEGPCYQNMPFKVMSKFSFLPRWPIFFVNFEMPYFQVTSRVQSGLASSED